MKKRFNTTGPCISSKHYMVNIENKLNEVKELIDNGYYFVINRPRQYGKTTMLSQISKILKDDYLIIRTSFEGVGHSMFESEEAFTVGFLNLLINILKFTDDERVIELEKLSLGINNFQMLSNVLTKFNKNSDKLVILLIDEIDTASNHELFLSFLGMLRNKYILANDDMDCTFHSVILAGVHDIKNIKLKIRSDEEKKYNSPWNIAVNFDVDMSFNSLEIETMLNDFSHNERISIETKEIASKIHYYTSGYPFLVSKICEIMNQNFKADWSIENIGKSIKILLNERNTLFDSLIKNLDNNVEFREFIKKIVLSGEEIVYVPSDSLITLGELYGFIRNKNNRCIIHNRIFEQYIYNHLIAIKSRESENITKYN